MLQYFETLQDESGNALSLDGTATVIVTNYPSGSLASIYSTNGTASPIAGSTVTADVTGQVSFFVPDGAYTLTYQINAATYKTKSPVQMLDPLGFVIATDTGSVNAYVVTSSAYPASLYTGLKIQVLIAHANTGASTLNLNSTGNQSILQPGGAVLSSGQLLANGIYCLEWDGAEWQLLSSTSNAPYTGTTAAEISAAVTPLNFTYPQGYLLRYYSGSGDMTAAFNNAVKVQGTAGGGLVVLPPSSVPVVSTIAITYANVWVIGQGLATSVTTNQATGDVIQVSANGVQLSDFAMTASVARSAGYFVNLNGSVSNVKTLRVSMTNFLNGYAISGAGPVGIIRLEDCNMVAGVAGGVGVYVGSAAPGADILFDRVTLAGPSPGTQMVSGFQIQNAGDITLRHCLATWCGIGLNVNPASGQNVQLLMVSQCELDSGTGNGVQLTPVSGGSIGLAKFTDTWSASSTGGSGFVVGANGNVYASFFENCNGQANSTGYGFLINSPTAYNTVVTNSYFGGNSNGMGVVSGVTKFKFLNNIVGPSVQAGPNAGFSLVLTGASSDEFHIVGNDFNNPGGTGAITAVFPSGGTPGGSWFIKDNQGFATQSNGTATLSAGSTTTVINHQLVSTPRLQDVLLTQQSSLGTATQAWVSAVTSTQFTITTNANPGAGVNMNWSARFGGN